MYCNFLLVCDCNTQSTNNCYNVEKHFVFINSNYNGGL